MAATKNEIRKAILKFAYECYLEGSGHHVMLQRMEAEWHRTDEGFSTCEALEREGLVKMQSSEVLALEEINVRNIERKGAVPAELIARARDMRESILIAALEQEEAGDSDPRIKSVLSAAGIEKEAGWAQLQYLESLSLLECTIDMSLGRMTLTELGRDDARVARRWRALSSEYERMKRLEGFTPQSRGRRLDHLVAEAARLDAWDAVAKVNARGEENDVIANKNHVFWYVSNKWEKEDAPCEAGALHELAGHLQSRGGGNGVLVSASGFSEGVRESISEKLAAGARIILFGPKDLDDLLLRRRTFSELVEEKEKVLEHVRRPLVDGEQW